MGELRTEPSMEDILASIKRIIADDSLTPGGRGRARAEPVEAEAPAPARPDNPPPADFAASESPPSVAAEPAPAERPATAMAASATPPPAPPPAAPTITPSPAEHPAALVSDDAASASRHALSTLSAMVVRTPGADNTLDGLVREMLKPLLKEWLDQRLPDLVETLVAREIARITDKSL